MSKNQLATQTKAPKFRNIRDIMKDPAAKAKLTNLVDEAVTCKTRITHEQQNIKVLRDAALEDLGLKPALFNQYVGAVFNNDYAQRKDAVEQVFDLLDTLMSDAQLGYDEGGDAN